MCSSYLTGGFSLRAERRWAAGQTLSIGPPHDRIPGPPNIVGAARHDVDHDFDTVLGGAGRGGLVTEG
jgi:hypothetical protein